jgi:fatty-acyl-CoA synthase
MPDPSAAGGLSVPLLCYEQLLDEAAEAGGLASFSWPRLHEDSPAGLCYTSGTTGNPKVWKCFPASTACHSCKHIGTSICSRTQQQPVVHLAV